MPQDFIPISGHRHIWQGRPPGYMRCQRPGSPGTVKTNTMNAMAYRQAQGNIDSNAEEAEEGYRARRLLYT